ncbi:hypothetical protein, partial [Salmonella enterica]|uniref:hypothetical protein n=1 Tax=Salmonella enterica TaxID=28901 RepID=UPI001C37C308
SEASHPARPTNVKRRPKGAFLLYTEFHDSTKLSGTILNNTTALARRASESRANGPALLVVETLQTQFMTENPGKTEYCTTPSLSFSTDIKGVICGRSYLSSFGLRSSESKTRRYRV